MMKYSTVVIPIMMALDALKEGRMTFDQYRSVLADLRYSIFGGRDDEYGVKENWPEASDLRANLVTLSVSGLKHRYAWFKEKAKRDEIDCAQAFALIALSDYLSVEIGAIDLKHVLDVVKLEPDEALEAMLEDAKKSIRAVTGLGSFAQKLAGSGLRERERDAIILESLEDDYHQGKIASLEELDKQLWALGFELADEAFCPTETRLAHELIYQDEPRETIGQTYPLRPDDFIIKGTQEE